MTGWRRLTRACAMLTGALAVILVAHTAHAQVRPVTRPTPAPVTTPAATPIASQAASSIASPHGPALREPCASCHQAKSWMPARIAPTFRHAERTFPLSGAHQRATCTSCHQQLDFKQTPTTCATCHTDPHKGEFGATCMRCHNTRSFVDRGTAVRTHQGTRFPLRGGHAIATCEACHGPTRPGQPQYQARGTTCAACHLATYQATKVPNHEVAGFPKDCTGCHSITTWTSAAFAHNTTRFPLAGAHRAVSCQGCHSDGVYRGKPTTCVSCHQAKFDATSQPNHRASAFPTTCESCHSATAWRPATFNHAATRFPLTGAHIAQTCLACHRDGVYRGKPTVCSACHTADYNATTNPNHRAAMFPTTCQSCHTTTRWLGATLNHDPWFPIYSGTHRQKWTSCTQCHTNSTNYGQFTCLSCHLKTETDREHQGQRAYRYESIACLSCHPRGSA
jgi:nitrate/TMAO reductase-like tetraheme cytochrome c subunit